MTKIEIYGREGCSYCARAKMLCANRGYEIVYHDISDPGTYDAFVERAEGARSIPQIYVGDRHIGGFTELQDADRSGVLQQLIGGF